MYGHYHGQNHTRFHFHLHMTMHESAPLVVADPLGVVCVAVLDEAQGTSSLSHNSVGADQGAVAIEPSTAP
jgi:hypothetical protein